MADNFQIPATAGPVTLRAKEISAGVYAVMKYVPDGYDEALGAQANAAATAADATPFSLISLAKGLLAAIGFAGDSAATTTGTVSGKLREAVSRLGSVYSSSQNLEALVATEGTQGNILNAIGASSDAAATAGGTGSVSAKLRVATASVGAVGDAAVTNPASSASVIAALKGLLTGLAGNLTVIQGTAASLKVEPDGSASSGAADTGKPIKVGGRYNSTLPTLTNGQRGDAQMDDRGRLMVNSDLLATQATLASVLTGLGATSDASPADPSDNANLLSRTKRMLEILDELLSTAQSEVPAGTFLIGGTMDGGSYYTTTLNTDGKIIDSADLTGSTNWVTTAPGSGLRIVVDDFKVTSGPSTATRVRLIEETSNDVIDSAFLGNNDKYQFTARGKLKALVDNKRLRVEADDAGDLTVAVIWHAEDLTP